MEVCSPAVKEVCTIRLVTDSADDVGPSAGPLVLDLRDTVVADTLSALLRDLRPKSRDDLVFGKVTEIFPVRNPRILWKAREYGDFRTGRESDPDMRLPEC